VKLNFTKKKAVVHENNTKERGAPVHTQEQNCSNIIYTFFPRGNNFIGIPFRPSGTSSVTAFHTSIYNESSKTCEKTGISSFLNDDA